MLHDKLLSTKALVLLVSFQPVGHFLPMPRQSNCAKHAEHDAATLLFALDAFSFQGNDKPSPLVATQKKDWTRDKRPTLTCHNMSIVPIASKNEDASMLQCNSYVVDYRHSFCNYILAFADFSIASASDLSSWPWKAYA